MRGRLLGYCHPMQRALVVDPARRKAALCGRRSGKTAGIAVELLLATLDHPNESCIAIAQSRGTARELFGSAISRVALDLGFTVGETTRDGSLYLLPEWGGRILLGGCPDRSEVNRYRGDRSVLVAVDEVESMRPWADVLVEEVLEPRLVDLDGTLILTSTPGPTPAGFFHRVTTGNEWSVHHWTMRENPFMSAYADREMERARKTRGEGTYRREWLGEWYTDAEALMFPCAPDNIVTEAECAAALLDKDVRTVIGVDIGFNDPCAWAVVQYVPGLPAVWVVEVCCFSGLTPSAAAARTLAMRERYPRSRVVVDSGGIGKGYAEEWRQKHGVPCEPAQKTNLGGSIAEVAGALRSGQLRLVGSRCQPLLDEWSVLQWNDGRNGPMSGQSDHCSDALRYAFRAANPANRPEYEYSEEERVRMEAEKRKADMIRRNRLAGAR